MRDTDREIGGRSRRAKESETRGCWKQKVAGKGWRNEGRDDEKEGNKEGRNS